MSLGNVARSRSRTLAPRRARSMASGAPAHRAPTTIISNMSDGVRQSSASRDAAREILDALQTEPEPHEQHTEHQRVRADDPDDCQRANRWAREEDQSEDQRTNPS